MIIEVSSRLVLCLGMLLLSMGVDKLLRIDRLLLRVALRIGLGVDILLKHHLMLMLDPLLRGDQLLVLIV